MAVRGHCTDGWRALRFAAPSQHKIALYRSSVCEGASLRHGSRLYARLCENILGCTDQNPCWFQLQLGCMTSSSDTPALVSVATIEDNGSVLTSSDSFPWLQCYSLWRYWVKLCDVIAVYAHFHPVNQVIIAYQWIWILQDWLPYWPLHGYVHG